VDGRQIRAVIARRDRRRHRAAHDRERLPAVAAQARGCRPRRPRRQHGAGRRLSPGRAATIVGRAAAAMPEMRRGGPHSPRRLRPVHQLRLLEMRLAY